MLTRLIPKRAIQLDLPESVQMTNGGTGPYDGELLIVNSGRANLPPTVAIVNPAPPHNTRILLDNFFGRQFNSINDVKIHPTSGAIFFTDPPCVPPSANRMHSG